MNTAQERTHLRPVSVDILREAGAALFEVHPSLGGPIFFSALRLRLRLIGLVLLLLLTCPVAAQAQSSTPYTTTADGNGGLIITKYTGSDSAVVIPSTITVSGTASPVTGIAQDAFYGNANITSVTIPNTVTDIGVDAFGECWNMKSVTIPNGLTTLEEGAFSQTGLTSVTLPDTVTVIGEGAFDMCSDLTHVKIGNGVTSIGDYAFEECSALTSLTLGNKVTSIGGFAFQQCPLLTTLTIPASVTSIGDQAFYDCAGVTSLLIGSNVTHIGAAAFNSCTSLTSVTIPASVTSIGQGAFDGCSKLTSIAMSAPNTAYSSAGGVLFNSNKTTLIECPGGLAESYTIPSSVLSIADVAFQGCAALTAVTIPNSVTSIGDQAFFGCSGLTGITLPNSVLSIGQGTFSSCTGLTSITIPASVMSIGTYAIDGCTHLTSAVFLGNAPTMGASVFLGAASNFTVSYYNNATGFGSPYWQPYENNGYTTVNLGNSPTPLFTNTTTAGPFTVTPDFNGSLIIIGYTGSGGAVTIPSTITINGVTYPVISLGPDAFYHCLTLTSVTIPDSVTAIGTGAFQSCTNLTSVTTGNGATTIGDQAFAWCTSLANVTLGSAVTSLGSQVFTGCTSLTHLTIPNGVTTLGSNLFFECSGLTSVIIPASVTSEGGSLFQACSNLTSVVYEGNAPAGASSFDFNQTPSALTVFYYNGTTGFTSPTWQGVPAINVGNLSDGLSLGGNILFGLIPINTTTTGTLRIINPGATPITVSSLSCPGGFTVNWSSGTIPAGGVQNVTVTFAPNVEAIYSGVISVNSNAHATTTTTPISGHGINPGPFTTVSDGNGGITITGYTGPYGPMVIPGLISGLNVTGIANYAFYNNHNITSVTIPDSVTSIGAEAFIYCGGITSVSLGQGVTTIGSEAFNSCYALQSISIPPSVTSLGFNAFSQCGLTAAYFYGNAPTLGGNVFVSESTSFKIVYSNNSTGFATPTWAPSNVDTYPAIPFYTITTSNGGVTLTGYDGPGGAIAISTVGGLPVVAIGADVFNGQPNLTSISIPASLTSIGTGAFAACPNLTSITVDPANPNYSSLGGVLFDKSQATLLQYPGGDVGLYTIPVSVTSIGQSAFQGAAHLTCVIIPASVTDIGAVAFGSCPGLISVTIPASVTNVEEGAFFACLNLTSAVFQGNAPTMGGYVFFNDAYGIAKGFTVSYYAGATGFTSPTWNPDATDSYPAVLVAGTPVPLMSFTQWSTAKGVPNAPSATPESDGVPNLLKYLYDIAPGTFMTTADRSALPSFDMATVQGTPCLTLSYRQNAAVAGIAINVQTSSDMQTWVSAANPTIVETGIDTTTGDPIMQVQVPITNPIQFVRLNVSQQ